MRVQNIRTKLSVLLAIALVGALLTWAAWGVYTGSPLQIVSTAKAQLQARESFALKVVQTQEVDMGAVVGSGLYVWTDTYYAEYGSLGGDDRMRQISSDAMTRTLPNGEMRPSSATCATEFLYVGPTVYRYDCTKSTWTKQQLQSHFILSRGQTRAEFVDAFLINTIKQIDTVQENGKTLSVYKGAVDPKAYAERWYKPRTLDQREDPQTSKMQEAQYAVVSAAEVERTVWIDKNTREIVRFREEISGTITDQVREQAGPTAPLKKHVINDVTYIPFDTGFLNVPTTYEVVGQR